MSKWTRVIGPCASCSKLESDWNGGLRCGAAQYRYNEGYGPFKQGAVCKHDLDLKDHFVGGENAKELEELSRRVKTLQSEKQQAMYEAAELRRRLTKV